VEKVFVQPEQVSTTDTAAKISC